MNIRPSSHEIPSPQFSTLTFPSSSSSNSSRAAAGAASHPFHPFSIHSTPLTLEEQQNINLTFRAIFPFRAPSSASRWVPKQTRPTIAFFVPRQPQIISLNVSEFTHFRSAITNHSLHCCSSSATATAQLYAYDNGVSTGTEQAKIYYPVSILVVLISRSAHFTFFTR